MYRSNKGSHVILPDLYPHNCINCGLGIDLLDELPCPNREMTVKELSKLRRDLDKVASRVSEDDNDALNNLFKGK